MSFKRKLKPQNSEKIFWRERVLDAFESRIFSIKTKGAGFSDFGHYNLKILTPKRVIQRSPIALAQVKAGNRPEKLLNEIRQVTYSLYPAKDVTKKYITI